MSTTQEVEGDLDPETNHNLPKEAPLLQIVPNKKALLTERNADGMYIYKETKAQSKNQAPPRFMVRVNDWRKTIWDIFIISVAIYNCFSIPLKIAFEPPILQTPLFEITDNIIDILFVLDIVVAFRTTFIDTLTGDEVFLPTRTSWKYIQTRFGIDLVSTVPVDTVALIFTGSRNPTLRMFSLLKLVRVTRLTRIIARLNVPAAIKNYMKLFQLIFMIQLYIHVWSCGWYYILMFDENKSWKPAHNGPDPTFDFYSDDGFVRRYLSTFYTSILLLTANDLGPVSGFQIGTVAVGILMGSIYNANIFGNMALLISEMNRKNDAFQAMIDTSNTAMKNLKLPSPIHAKIVAYLNYIYLSMDQQKELRTFFDSISPTLMDEVVVYIFAQALKRNRMLRFCKTFNEQLIVSIKLICCVPEEQLIKQDDPPGDFFIVSKGDCQVFAKDARSQAKYVRTIYPGMHFGEVAVIKRCKRTATVQSKDFSIIGRVQQLIFLELMQQFPTIKQRMIQSFTFYQDRYKMWLKSLLFKVSFLTKASFENMEIIVQKVIMEELEEDFVLFKTGDTVNKIYVLMSGEVETYLQMADETMILDQVSEPGSVFAEASVLNQKEGINFCARVSKPAKFMCITTGHLQIFGQQMPVIKQEIHNATSKLSYRGFPLVDYKIQPKLTDEDGNPTVFDAKQSLVHGIEKVLKIKACKRGKGFKLADLMKYLKRISLTEDNAMNEQVDDALARYNDIFTEKLFSVLADAQDQMLVQQERQNFKIARIQHLMNQIKNSGKNKNLILSIAIADSSNESETMEVSRPMIQFGQDDSIIQKASFEGPPKMPVTIPKISLINCEKVDAVTQMTPTNPTQSDLNSPTRSAALQNVQKSQFETRRIMQQSDKHNFIEFEANDKTDLSFKFAEGASITDLKNFDEWQSLHKSTSIIPQYRKPLLIMPKDNTKEQLKLFSQWKKQSKDIPRDLSKSETQKGSENPLASLLQEVVEAVDPASVEADPETDDSIDIGMKL